MCGIFGYVGPKTNVKEILLEGLHQLEYRGYDSAGLSIITKEGIKTVKSEGKISILEDKISHLEFEGNIGIGHTRWATHGEPNEVNAHPHTSCDHSISVVHNGIIENFRELREELISKGHTFKSDTDSEVLAHLIEEYYNGDLKEAVRKTLRRIRGAYGIAVLHKDEKVIVAARMSSPLIVGVGHNESYISSDAAPLIGKVSKVIYLEDGELICLRGDSYEVSSIRDGSTINKSLNTIDLDPSTVKKGNFKHFMLKEIFEQPESLNNLLRGRIKDGLIKLSLNVNLNTVSRIIIVGCGTSWHAGLIGKYYIEKLVGVPVDVEIASEFNYREQPFDHSDLVLVISQSGETADTLTSVRKAKKNGLRVLGIVNVVGSTIAREVDGGIYLRAGPEISVASTKAFTSQVLALLLFALYMKQVRGGSLDPELLREITNIPELVKKVLENAPKIEYIAKTIGSRNAFLFLGRNVNYPVALEGALKLKEISYLHAEGYPSGEIKHGPIALIEDGYPVITIAPEDQLFEKMLSNMEEVKARGADLIPIVNDPEKVKHFSDKSIVIPKCNPLLTPLLSVIPLQLLAYYIADYRGLDVDKPRNLAKSVTVE